MAIPRDLEIERRQRSGAQFSEPVERRGDWNDGSLTAAARRAWDQKQLGVLVDGNEKTVARGLGWFSIGLGLVEVLAPRTVERFLGIKHPWIFAAHNGIARNRVWHGNLSRASTSELAMGACRRRCDRYGRSRHGAQLGYGETRQYRIGFRGGRRHHGFRHPLRPGT